LLPEDVKTLRDLWMWHNLSSQDMADRTGLSRETLYKMNRKEGGNTRSIFTVCRVLGITRADYDALEACPMAERFRDKR
jgi:DNA-binding phage protein